jgi:hypothetical protein
MFTVPNVSLAKEQSNPNIYLIVGDTKFWITDPAEFDALGFQWSKVLTVGDGALSHFKNNILHSLVLTRPSEVFFDWAADPGDFNNRPFSHQGGDGKYYANTQPSENLLRHDVLVAGWLYGTRTLDTNQTDVGVYWRCQAAPEINTDGFGAPTVEDMHYNLVLDATFLDRVYGPDGLSTALTGASYPGNPVATHLPFADGSQVTFNSWILPGTDQDLHCELNTWHVNNAGHSFATWTEGRGAPPADWVSPLPADIDPDAWYPFDVHDPEGTGAVLQPLTYVVIRGSLWQDGEHGTFGSSPWDFGNTIGHSGYPELHPVDWIARCAPPQVNAAVTTTWMAVTGTSTASGHVWLYPQTSSGPLPDGQPLLRPAPGRWLEVREVQQQFDKRITNPPGMTVSVTYQAASPPPGTITNTNAAWYVSASADHFDVTLTAYASPQPFQEIRVKASWLVGWREVSGLDNVLVDDFPLPAGAIMDADNDSWTWVTANPTPFHGSQAHQSAAATGMHRHYFTRGKPLAEIAATDELFSMVYLDPLNPPDQVMLQWAAEVWYCAYWGADRIVFPKPVKTSVYMGPLPFSGEWVRLEVPASTLGLGGKSVTGMAFTLFNGKATWDYAGVFTPPPRNLT